jgi:hypothetical protein
MNTTTKADAGENVLWPGATHILTRVCAKIPSGFGGRSRPQYVRSLANLKAIPRPHSRQFLSEQTDAAHMRKPGPTQENPCLY